MNNSMLTIINCILENMNDSVQNLEKCEKYVLKEKKNFTDRGRNTFITNWMLQL